MFIEQYLCVFKSSVPYLKHRFLNVTVKVSPVDSVRLLLCRLIRMFVFIILQLFVSVFILNIIAVYLLNIC